MALLRGKLWSERKCFSMENLARDIPPVTEIIEGKVYLMSPHPRMGHNFTASNIYRIFANYLAGKPCKAIADGSDVFLDNENRYVPDVMIVCDRSKIHRDGIHGAPDLVVEVLSPSTTKNDRGAKMLHYAAAGVKEYWIVTPIGKTVEVYRNQDGRFFLDAVYTDYDDWELAHMDDDERADVHMEIPVLLYEDFYVRVKDVFDDIDDFT